MTDKKNPSNLDDASLPDVDIPTHLSSKTEAKNQANVEPLPEASRPRKDGPGGEGGE